MVADLAQAEAEAKEDEDDRGPETDELGHESLCPAFPEACGRQKSRGPKAAPRSATQMSLHPVGASSGWTEGQGLGLQLEAPVVQAFRKAYEEPSVASWEPHAVPSSR